VAAVPKGVFRASHFGDPPLDISNRTFDRTLFDNCSIAQPSHPSQRSIIRAVNLTRCAHRCCLIAGAAIEDCRIDGLTRQGDIPLFLSGVVFRHVVLAGRIGFFKLNLAPSLRSAPSETALWKEANQRYYESTDWALDISSAEFTFAPDLHFIPGSLIRRDPGSQALVSRANLSGADLATLPWGHSSLRVAVDWFLQNGPYEDVVLAAGKKSRGYSDDVAAIKMLRERGLAAPW
jgi:hypothetical protein